MGLFGKIKEILFDEETVEIPVITKEEREEKKETKASPKPKENMTRLKKNDDEVIIRKIETPKKDTSKNDDLFDMPKFKEEVKEEKKANSFTFPVFNDDDIKEIAEPKRTKRNTKNYEDEPQLETVPKRTTINEPTTKPERNAGGYTTAYDYSYGKYKGDYKTSRESNQEVLTRTLEKKEERSGFTPSPIISPVYGVLNENYKKEDIVTKHDSYKSNANALDLDSVRRKAYGTLEDDIENSLDRQEEFVEEPIIEEDTFDDEAGISINDLLVDSSEDDILDEINDQTSEIELFDVPAKEEIREPDFSPQKEIEITDTEEEPVLPETKTVGEMEEMNLEEEEEENPIIVLHEDTKPKEKKIPKANVVETVEDEKVGLGEEDLFDLIDSLYDGKGED